MTSTINTQKLYDQAECLVPLGTVMKGDVNAPEPMVFVVNGHFEGSINLGSGGAIVIAPTAKVVADSIEADDILIEGEISGRLHARNALVLADTGKVKGEARYGKTLTVQPKAKINGQLIDTSWTD
jgi:cytoskeletal protein CcmA (bactofilin family)